MPDCTQSAYSTGILTYVLPPAGALLSATALWVASRARSTSKDAQSTSLAVGHRSGLLPERRAPSGSPPRVRDRRK
jgi:hypothetical protein